MKNYHYRPWGLLATLFATLLLISCTKTEDIGPNPFDWRTASPQEIAVNYATTYQVTDAVMTADVDRGYLTQAEFDYLWAEGFEKTGLWSREDLTKVIPIGADHSALLMTVTDKKRYLDERLIGPRNNYETNLETIARRQTGNANVNGGQAYWDCSGSLLAQTIAQLGQNVGAHAINNYYNAGTSAATITSSDLLRASNGYYNMAFNSTIELLDVVFEFQVSGDGNWLVGVVINYEGTEYIYSSDPQISSLGPLIYDPVPGGITIVGPMPGGVVEIDVTGLYEPPAEE